ncbi:MAG: TetR/AcrR family transcriptional regulator [Candidatus Marinimicrobia bacterium]|jgi:AcrR family transcriptional regulator|nr:TetR/AcrR family transcriptional regulator [Gammaproteobacteria bacterium]MBL6911885.1 TetR/AcrR family transcriptional regulator [Candidatus Neomarinimicrobiota bacterium]MBT3727823.1 TetR/AcrR family transcriptional regulator [Candidatus Neomarinimicrobiota bacterium]MBT3943928.1 TetR/AcrR family transcriptional regulator [Candidatus Neomarinimicrobiota bacterium]MBT4111575.1 TetR/AcrR family transcriptional regulator [Candidatus Neomarinimicrobiota bacterium]
MKKEQQNNKKDLIMSAALKVMTKKGYYGSTMDDIVLESNMSKGAIYHYYESKKEIYLELIVYLESKYTDMFATVNKESTSAKKLKKLFTIWSDQLEKEPDFFQSFSIFQSMSGHDKDFKQAMQRMYSRFQKFIELIIIEGIKSKEFKKINPKTSALSLILNLDGISWFSLFESKNLDAKSYIDQMSDYILNTYISKEGK